MSTKTMKINLTNLLQEAAATCMSPAITMGAKLTVQSLQRLAERAVEINDPVILRELDFLGFVTISGETPGEPK